VICGNRSGDHFGTRHPCRKIQYKTVNRQTLFTGSIRTPPEGQKGSRNKATVAAEAPPSGKAETLARKAKELALNGNLIALKLCLNCIAPVRKERYFEFKLPKTKTLTDIAHTPLAVVDAMMSGELTSEEASNAAIAVEKLGWLASAAGLSR